VSVKTQQKEMQTATLELGPCIWEFSLFLHCVNTEQIESDFASARKALAGAAAGIDEMRKELKALVDKVAKSEVRTHPLLLPKPKPLADPTHANHYDDRRSTARQRAVRRKNVRR
jgi:hypothetical protein